MTDAGRHESKNLTRKPKAKRGVLALVKNVLPHLCIIMCIMLLVFFGIDRVNSHIGFMKNEFHKWLTFALCVAVLMQSMIMYVENRRQALKRIRRAGTDGQKAAKGKVK